jgi:alpha-tubulin suppressor-like RCC1 family protein
MVASTGTRESLVVLGVVLIAACSENSALGPELSAPFGSVSAGVLHTCALTTDGRAHCWGWGERGQLGSGEGGSNYLSVGRVSVASQP